MPTGQGAASKAAGKIESGAYGVPIALNGGGEFNQLHYLSESLTPSFDMESSMHLDGTSGKKSLYPVLKKFGGDLSIEMHYDGLTSLLICALGMSNQDVSPVSLGSGGYAHYIEPSHDLATRTANAYEEKAIAVTLRRRMTIGFEKSVSIHENMSCMVNSFSMEIKPDRSVMNFNLVPYNQEMDSATNAASTNWAVPTVASQLSWENALVYLKPRDLYNIGASENTINVSENSAGSVAINLTVAEYSGFELAQELQSQLNSTLVSNLYKCFYAEETRRFKVTCDDLTFRFIAGGDNLNDILAMAYPAAEASSQESEFAALPSAYAAFDSGDQLGISSFSMSYNNGIAAEDQDSLSSALIVEPERNELRTISGVVEIPRYQNDTFIKAANGNTTYEMWIQFTGNIIGGAISEQFNMYLTSVKFSSSDVPVSGPNILKQTLNFQAAFPDYLDFINFFDTAYFVQEDFLDGAAGAISALGTYIDGLYSGSGTSLEQFTKEAGTVAAGSTTGTIGALRQYQNLLYIGEAAGVIQTWDGSALALSCDVGAGAVSALQQYGDDLYALEQTTGRVNKLTAAGVWSLSCDTALTDATDMISYDGYLWVYGSDGGNIDIFNYDGSTWATAGVAVDVSAAAAGGFTIHLGRLYLASLDKIFVWDNVSAWVEVADIGASSILAIFSWKGELLVAALDDKLYLINLAAASAVSLITLGNTPSGKAVHYEGHVFIPDDTTSATLLKNIQEIYFKLHNATSANPL